MRRPRSSAHRSRSRIWPPETCSREQNESRCSGARVPDGRDLDPSCEDALAGLVNVLHRAEEICRRGSASAQARWQPIRKTARRTSSWRECCQHEGKNDEAAQQLQACCEGQSRRSACALELGSSTQRPARTPRLSSSFAIAVQKMPQRCGGALRPRRAADARRRSIQKRNRSC